MFERMMLLVAEKHGLRYLSEFDLDTVRAFRESWPLHRSAAGRQVDRIKSFFSFTHASRWISENPGLKLKTAKVAVPPTGPFSREQMAAIVAASDDHE